MLILENEIALVNELKNEFNVIKECLWQNRYFKRSWFIKTRTKQWRFLFWFKKCSKGWKKT